MSIVSKIVGKGIDSRAYHAGKMENLRGSPKYAMSSSSLREFGKCPSRWVKGYNPPDSDAKDWGKLLDTRLLTPHLFESTYAIKPVIYTTDKGEEKPWNGNATVCKEWIEEHKGVEIVSVSDVMACDAAIKELRADEIISAFVDASDTQVLVSGYYQDKKTGIELPLECLIDLAPRSDTEFAKCLGDLKSTRNAAIAPWQRWCFQAGYHVQAAFNTDLYVAATGEDRNTFCFILQENFAPWMPAKRLLSQDFLDLGRAEYKRLLENYCQCLKRGQWPSYDDTDESVQGWSIVAPEPFMAERRAFAPRFELEPENAPESEHDGEIIP